MFVVLTLAIFGLICGLVAIVVGSCLFGEHCVHRQNHNDVEFGLLCSVLLSVVLTFLWTWLVVTYYPLGKQIVMNYWK